MDTRTPQVSIALRSYNQRSFLKEAIDSILAQTYADFEIIIADDASTDGSIELIKAYTVQYPAKIMPVFSEKNLGHTANFNKALSACSGKYVAVFDGDDVMHPEKLEKQVAFMEQNPKCVVCYHNTEFFNHKTNTTLYLKNHKNNSHQGDVRIMIKYGMFNTNISNMIRRNKIPQKGANERITIASDWLFYVETLVGGGEIRYIDETLARVRRHPGNITKTKVFKNLSDQVLSSFIVIKKHPRFFFHVLYRWYDGLKNQLQQKRSD